MSLPKEIKLTPEGGHYYKAMMFRYVLTALLIVPVVIALLMAILNPLWFRDSFFRWTENKVNAISLWRNYRMYAIYLGCDPKIWHTLKDVS